jgi:hypothetical protein
MGGMQGVVRNVFRRGGVGQQRLPVHHEWLLEGAERTVLCTLLQHLEDDEDANGGTKAELWKGGPTCDRTLPSQGPLFTRYRLCFIFCTKAAKFPAKTGPQPGHAMANRPPDNPLTAETSLDKPCFTPTT